MNKDKSINELFSLIQNNGNPEILLNTADAEEFLENSTSKMLKRLIEFKEQIRKKKILVDTNELKLSRLCTEIVELLTKKDKIRRKEFTLPQTLARVFCEEKLIEICDGVYENIEVTLKAIKYEQDIVNTAEEWIYTVKSIYAQSDFNGSSFYEEKVFWQSFYKQLASFNDFSLSDEYRFLLKLLERIGRRKLYYTLEVLFKSHRISKLAECFNVVFNSFDFSFINEEEQIYENCSTTTIEHIPEHSFAEDGSDTIDPQCTDGAIYSNPSTFVDSCLIVLRKFLNLQKQPRIIQKSIHKHLINLRVLILKHSLAHFNPVIFDLFTQFHLLSTFLNLANETGTNETFIDTFDSIKGMGDYLNALEQIKMVHDLYKIAYKRIDCSELIELLRIYEYQFKHQVASELGLENTIASPINTSSIMQPESSGNIHIEAADFIKNANILNSDAYLKAIHKLADDFVSHKFTDLSLIFDHYSKSRDLFKHKIFNERTREYNHSVANTLANVILSVYRPLTIEHSEPVLSMASVYAMISDILIYFEDDTLLETQLEALKVELHSYLDGIHIDFKDSFIFVYGMMDYGDQSNPKYSCDFHMDQFVIHAPTDSSSDQSINEHVSVVHMISLNNLRLFSSRDILYKINDLVFHKELRRFCDDLNQYDSSISNLVHIFEKYRKISMMDHSLFSNQEIEEYFKSLINLKWKYFNETKFKEICVVFSKLEQGYKNYSNSFENLFNTHIHKIVGEKKKLSIDNISKYFTIDFPKIEIIGSLQRKSRLIMDRYLSYLLDCFSTGSNVIALKFKVKVSGNEINYYIHDTNSHLPINDCAEHYLLEDFKRSIMLSDEFNTNESTQYPNLLSFFNIQMNRLRSIIDDSTMEISVSNVLQTMEEQSTVRKASEILIESYKNIKRKYKAIEQIHKNQVEHFDIECSLEFDENEIERDIQSICSSADKYIDSLVIIAEESLDNTRMAENDAICVYETYFEVHRIVNELKDLFIEIHSNNVSELVSRTKLGVLNGLAGFRMSSSRVYPSSKDDGGNGNSYGHSVRFNGNDAADSNEDSGTDQDLCISINDTKLCITDEIILNFISGQMKDPAMKSNLFTIHEFTPKPCLTKEHHKEIEEKRRDLQERSNRIAESFNSFEHDEFDFVPFSEELISLKTSLSKEIRRFNAFLGHYQFKLLDFDQPVEVLKSEYEMYKQKKGYIEEYMHVPVKTCNISLNTICYGIDKDFKSKLMKDFCKSVDLMRIPLDYLNHLVKAPKYLDETMTMKQYLKWFDAAEAKAIINKGKLDDQISKYLKDFCFDIRSSINLRNSLNLNFVCNLEQILELLDQCINDHDIIVKFNKYNLFLAELQDIQSSVLLQRTLVLNLKAIQDEIFSIINIFTIDPELLDDEMINNRPVRDSKECVEIEYEKHKFDEVKAKFNSTVTAIVHGSPCECSIKRLKDIEDGINSIHSGLEGAFDHCRSQANRLYFVSNEDLIKAMNNRSHICNLIKTVFNIEEILIDKNMIVGMVSGEDRISLIEQIDLNDPVYAVMNSFESVLGDTLKTYFQYKLKASTHWAVDGNMESKDPVSSSNRIAVVDELISELDYFDNRNPVNIPYRIQKINEYSRMFPDFLKIYPKPVYRVDTERQINESDKTEGVLFVGPIQYEFEYYPPTSFIFTCLTAKIFSAIILSLGRSGLILYGPSGTGKTESIKYFCRTVGKPLYTFCCNEKCEAKSLINIITGCSKSNSYLCFDEFNRLRKDVMSAVTECMFEFKEKTKIFLTMNLGYKGRFELPESLKSIFGEIQVAEPDIKDIIFYYTKNYDLFHLLTDLKSKCIPDNTTYLSSKTDIAACHYDFGLRAIKFILSGNSSLDINSRLIYFYMATLKEAHKSIFLAALKDTMGISKIDLDLSYRNLFKVGICMMGSVIVSGGKGKTKLIESVANELNNKKSGEIFDLNGSVEISQESNKNMIDATVQHPLDKDVILNKTQAIENIGRPDQKDAKANSQTAHAQSMIESVKMFRYNASNLLLTNDSIFGSINKITREWNDSLFLKDLRMCLVDKQDGSDYWFIFDSPIKTEWIEDFNSVLDENRLICISTGERIKIPFSFKFVFECSHVKDVTPATMTRVFHLDITNEAKTKIVKNEAKIQACIESKNNEQLVVESRIDEQLVVDREQIQDSLDIIFDEDQYQTALMLGNLLKRENVVFLKGLCGVGKKFIVDRFFKIHVRVIRARDAFDQADSGYELGNDQNAPNMKVNARSDIILDSSKIDDSNLYNVREVIFIEEFHKADVMLQEQVREFGEFGRIGEYLVKNVKIVCGFDEESTRICPRLKRFGSVELKEPKSIENIIRRMLCCKNLTGSTGIDICTDFSLFLHNTFALSIRQVTTFVKSVADLLDSDLLHKFISIDDCLYFVSSIHFGENLVAKKFLENKRIEYNRNCTLECRLDNLLMTEKIKELMFNIETNRLEEIDRKIKNRTESIIHYLLNRGMNVVVRGPRLSGKRRLIDRCLDKSKELGNSIENLQLVHWTEIPKVKNIIQSKLQFIVIADIGTKPHEKLLKENSIEIIMDEVPLILNTERLLEGESFENTIDHSNKSVKYNKMASICENPFGCEGSSEKCSRNISVYEELKESVHGKACFHQESIVFENLYKMIDFYKIFNDLAQIFNQEFNDRKTFLRSGLVRIEQFGRDAEALKSEIERKSANLKIESQKLQENIELLSKEKEIAHKEESEIMRQKEMLKDEMKESAERRLTVNKRMTDVLELLEESKKGISLLNKNQVSEIKAMNNPPEIVRKTIECVYYLLEQTESRIEWPGLQSYLKREDFVSKVLSNCIVDGHLGSDFDSNVLDGVRQHGESNGKTEDSEPRSLINERVEEMFRDNNFTFEKVNKASKACGHFHNWISSLIKYKDVNKELEPLKSDLKALNKKIVEQMNVLQEKESQLNKHNSLVAHIESSIEANQRETHRKTLEIRDLIMDLENLKEIIRRFDDEAKSWKCLKFECPLSYMLENKHVLAYCNNVYIDSITFNDLSGNKSIDSPDTTKPTANGGVNSRTVGFNQIKDECITVSVADKSFKKIIANAVYYNSNLLIKDVTGFDPAIYSLLKSRMHQTNTKVILQGNSENCYLNETYKYVNLPKFTISRRSLLNYYENELLNSLVNCKSNEIQAASLEDAVKVVDNLKAYDLKGILELQILLEEERRLLREEDELRKKYEHLNGRYKDFHDLFTMIYQAPLPFNIFREFVMKNNIFDITDQKSIDSKLSGFFWSSFDPLIANMNIHCFQFENEPIRDTSTNAILRRDCDVFSTDEILEYSFDYTFITSFTDVLFELRKLIQFDFEVSAGSPENNSKIQNLLAEQSNKIILVKNTEFLPKCIKKNGTNRFIYIIGKNEYHPLMNQTRIVYLDRKDGFESIHKSLTNLFDCKNDGVGRLIKFHAAVMEAKLGFSFKDLEICIENPSLSFEFLTEIVYFNRMTKEEKHRIMALNL